MRPKDFWSRVLCSKGIHNYYEFMRKANTTIFYCRRCSRCGFTQIQNTGPMGNNEWNSINSVTNKYPKWEKELFEKSMPYHR